MSWNEEGRTSPLEADVTPWSGMDAITFAWKLAKADFFPIVVPLFLAQLLALLPTMILIGVQTAHSVSMIQAGRLPDPTDPFVLGMQGASTVITWLTFGFINPGVYRFAIAAARGEPRSFGDVFSGGRWFGASVTFMALVGFLSLPATLVPIAIRVAGAPPWLQLPITLVLILPGLFLALGWSMALPLIVDRGLGAVAAMKESWRITSGRRVDVFVAFLVLFCMGIAGCCLCGLGMPIAMGLAPLTFAFIYLRLTSQPDCMRTP